MQIPVDRLAIQEIVYRLREPEDKWLVTRPAESDSRNVGTNSLSKIARRTPASNRLIYRRERSTRQSA
jgi:hypothetical protein